MSFRTRFYRSTQRGSHASSSMEKSNGASTTLTSEKSFSARDSRRSLRRDEFSKSTRSGLVEGDRDDDAEKHLGYAFSRTTRKGVRTVYEQLRSAGSDEDIVNALCGASALSDDDLVMLTAIDCGTFRSFLAHESSVVRCAAVRVFSDISLRLWDWFVSNVSGPEEDVETAQQDLRSWIVQLWRAIADRCTDDEDFVAYASFEAMDTMTRTRQVLAERVARHQLNSLMLVVGRASSLKHVNALRVTTHLLLFALMESTPHALAPVTQQSHQSVQSALSFLNSTLLPIMEGHYMSSGDVCLTSAECALDLILLLSPFCAYDTGKVTSICANTALGQLRTIETTTNVNLPDSCRKSRRNRCCELLIRSAERADILPDRQRVRILGRCVSVAARDSMMIDILLQATNKIVAIELAHPEEAAVSSLISGEKSLLRPIWMGTGDKAKHRLAASFLVATLNHCTLLTNDQISESQWTEVTFRLLELFADCLAWNDSSFKDHRAGHAYVDLLSRAAFMSLLTMENEPKLEKLVRSIIEWRIKTTQNVQVRARLLYVCERALCGFPQSNPSLAKHIVDATRHLAVTADPNDFASSSSPLSERFNVDKDKGANAGLFSIALDILNHVARNISGMKNEVAGALGHLSTLSQHMMPSERKLLDLCTKDMERPRSAGASGKLKSPASSPSRDLAGVRSRLALDLFPVVDPSLVSRHTDELRALAAKRIFMEKQLSGGSDPLYVVSMVQLDSHARPTLLLRISNVSNLTMRSLTISAAARGSLQPEPGAQNVFRLASELAPGSLCLTKFAFSTLTEKSFTLVPRRGVDIRVSVESKDYSLPTLWISPFLWLKPNKIDFNTFRHMFNQQSSEFSSYKVALKVYAAPEEIMEAIVQQGKNSWGVTIASKRLIMLTAKPCEGNDDRILLCSIQLVPQDSSGTSVAIEFRTGSIDAFDGCDLREAILLTWFRGLQAKVTWSGSIWPGSVRTLGKTDKGDEFTSPETAWSVSSGEATPIVPINTDVFIQAGNTWRALQSSNPAPWAVHS